MEVLRDETTQRGFTWIQTAAGSTPSFSLESACLSSSAVSFAMNTYAGLPAVQRRERLRIAAPPGSMQMQLRLGETDICARHES